MADQDAIAAGRTAVITGGASGIGLAAARRFAALGMNVVIADVREAELAAAAGEVAKLGPGRVLTTRCDVSRREEVARLRDEAYAAFGDVAVLMNNAGIGAGGGPFDNFAGWERVIATNLWGVVHGVHEFTPAMIGQGSRARIINTGSKQGITCPPGNTAYNVAKAGVKALTEGLQHTLRNTPGCQVTAHLLVQGWVHTGLTARGGVAKPAGAWAPEQAIDYLLEHLARGDFYIVCPDNEVSSELDRKRILWAAGDIAENRPPLSRWHPDYAEAFARFLRSE